MGMTSPLVQCQRSLTNQVAHYYSSKSLCSIGAIYLAFSDT